jgi:hypothetical protein
MHHIDVGSVFDTLEVPDILIFGVELCRMCQYSCMCRIQSDNTRKLPGSKRWPARKADKFTAICEPIVYKTWEPMGLHGLLPFTLYLTYAPNLVRFEYTFPVLRCRRRYKFWGHGKAIVSSLYFRIYTVYY